MLTPLPGDIVRENERLRNHFASSLLAVTLGDRSLVILFVDNLKI
jgi:hypothetical protein